MSGTGRFSGKKTLSKPEPFQKQTSVPRSITPTPGGLSRKPYATRFESADHTRTDSGAWKRSVSEALCRVTGIGSAVQSDHNFARVLLDQLHYRMVFIVLWLSYPQREASI